MAPVPLPTAKRAFSADIQRELAIRTVQIVYRIRDAAPIEQVSCSLLHFIHSLSSVYTPPLLSPTMAHMNGHTSSTVGYIGLGNAGYPLASTLARAGYATVVKDAEPERAKKFASEHANSAAVTTDDSNAFSNVDVLVTMLPNGEIVRDVLLGSGDLAKYLKDEAVIIDTSSSSPYHTRETAELLQKLNPSLTSVSYTHLTLPTKRIV